MSDTVNLILAFCSAVLHRYHYTVGFGFCGTQCISVLERKYSVKKPKDCYLSACFISIVRVKPRENERL